LVFDEVTELRIVLFAERLLEREGKLRHPQDLPHLVTRHLELGCDLIRSWLPRQFLDELAFDSHDLAQPLDHMNRDADRPCLVGDRARHRLPDPPGCVGRELEAAAIVELLDCADQPQRALLDQIEEGEPATDVRLRDRHDEPEIRLDHLRLRGLVPALDPLRQGNLLVSTQQRYLADVPQVEAQRVERRLHAQIEFRRRLRLVLGDRRLLMRRILVLLAFDQLDRTVDQVGIEVVDLLLRQLNVLKRGGDLVIGQKPLLDAFRYELQQFPCAGTTVSRPELSSLASALALTLRDGEPSVRVLQHGQEITCSPERVGFVNSIFCGTMESVARDGLVGKLERSADASPLLRACFRLRRAPCGFWSDGCGERLLRLWEIRASSVCVLAPSSPVRDVVRGRCFFMANGTVKWFNDSKGYGFISPDEGSNDLFVHHSNIAGDGFKSLVEGARVSFEQREGSKGPEATNVVPVA